MLKKWTKSLLTASALALGLLVTPTDSLAAPSTSDITVEVNGTTLTLDPGTYVENGRSLVPLAQICEAVDATVEWREEGGIILIHRGTSIVKLQIAYDHMGKSDFSTTAYEALDAAPQIIEDRTYVPLAAVSQALGAEVVWVQESSTAKITLAPTTASPTKTEYTQYGTNAAGEKIEVATFYRSNVVEPMLPYEYFGQIPAGPPLNRSNAISTGSNTMDFLLDCYLATVVGDNMTPKQELQEAYYFCAQNYDHNYDYYNIYHDMLDEDYYRYADTYSSIFSTMYLKIGVCPQITSIFIAAAQRLGYDAQYETGILINRNGSQTDHYWAQVDVGGEIYHFDPDYESILRVFYKIPIDYCRFMQTLDESKRWHIWGDDLNNV